MRHRSLVFYFSVRYLVFHRFNNSSMDCNQHPITSCYYATLGVNRNSSISEIRRAYRKLAMRWHPDRWTRTPSLLGEAQQKFQQIQEAYAVLSDQRKRSLYDAGLYDANDDDHVDEEEDNGFSDFLQEMLSLMSSVKREGKVYSLEELQQMLTEMAQGVDISQWCDGEESLEDSRASKRAKWSSSSLPTTIRSSHVCVSDLRVCR